MSEIAYESQCARDAQRMGYGDKRYWDELEDYCSRMSAYFEKKGDKETAQLMLNRPLSEALVGNDKA